MSKALKRLVLVAATCGVLGIPTATALAHALLVRSNPPANARLDSSPGFVEMVFSETLEPAFSSAVVLGPSGARVDNRDANVDPSDPTRMTLTLRPISDGVYTVSWRATSAIDGHTTTGAFAFVIGATGALPASGLAPAPASGPPPAEVVAKWLGYLAAASIVGGALFLLAVWDPALRRVKGEQDLLLSPHWRPLGGAGVALALFAGLIGLWVEASVAAGPGLDPFRGPAFGEAVLA
ncbi:MAG TPA: copper resistance protein CopC, partial [Anaerolineales bacterium]|nr:copper resistance protein CopC [Anaerolineales bacterium]